MNYLDKTLSDEGTYTEIIAKYEELLQNSGRSPTNLKYYRENKTWLARKLSEAIKQQQFEFEPAKQIKLMVSQRQKKLFIFAPADVIVIKAMLNAISPTFANNASPYLYSYIKNRSVRQPILRFSNYLNQHRKKNHGCVDLFLHKLDLKQFYESIPTHSNSIIWDQLSQLLDLADAEHSLPPYIRSLYIKAVRPNYMSVHAGLAENIRGIPYGSPISGLIGNLYASPLDKVIEKYPDIFYARYSDDVLVAHPDRSVLVTVIEELHSIISTLELVRSNNKERWFYFTKCGMTLKGDTLFRGSNSISYLGCVIHADGRIHSTNRKTRFFLALCEKSILNSNRLFDALPISERGAMICRKLSEDLLSDDSSLLRQLFFKTNDHAFLAQLDKKIALNIAEQLTGINGVRAFRALPYQVIRTEFGLPSLSIMRNNFAS